VNYLKQILAFHNWLETNQLDAAEQALWFHLMEINNKCGWTEWFAVANMTLQARLGVDRKTLDRKRQTLINKGRIHYKNQGKREAGKYSIIQFRDIFEGNIPVETGLNVPNNVPKASLGMSTLNKLNKTKKGVSKDTPLPALKFLIDYYYEKFKEKFGVPPIISRGKDGALLKELLLNLTDKDLVVLMNHFFESEDPFIKQSGYTIGVFKTQINKLITQTKSKKEDNHGRTSAGRQYTEITDWAERFYGETSGEGETYTEEQ